MSRAGRGAARAPSRRTARAGGRGAPAVLWRFGRPHTIIGTTARHLGALRDRRRGARRRRRSAAELFDLFWTLVAGWCVNVFIVGINQLEDVEIDRINKP